MRNVLLGVVAVCLVVLATVAVIDVRSGGSEPATVNVHYCSESSNPLTGIYQRPKDPFGVSSRSC